jgi:hypothetical protein
MMLTCQILLFPFVLLVNILTLPFTLPYGVYSAIRYRNTKKLGVMLWAVLIMTHNLVDPGLQFGWQ